MQILTKYILLIAMFLSAGCQSSQTINNPSTIQADQYRQTFDAARQSLRDAGFTVDRVDYRFGQVTTLPKGSPTVFEPWIGDNVDPQLAKASTLGNLRRTVRVMLEPEDAEFAKAVQPEVSEADTYRLRVEVLVERYQDPARRMNGSTKGAVTYNLRSTPEELDSRGVRTAYWEPVRRDARLERVLLQRILAAADQSEQMPGS
jgi:hypothetical protein